MTEHTRTNKGQPGGTASGNVHPVTPTTRRYRIGWPLFIALVLISGVWCGGAVWSFAEQTAYATYTHFEIPELLPLVIDGLAVAMAAVAWAASLDGRAAIGARIGAALAVAGSAASNAAWAAVRSNLDPGTIALAVAVPIAANVAFEVLLAEIRKQVQRYRGLPAPPQLPSPHWKRLVLSPWKTFFQWRREVLKATELAPLFAAAARAAAVSARGSDTPAGGPSEVSGETPAEHPWAVPVPQHLRVPVRCATPLRNPSGGTGTGTPAGTSSAGVSEPRVNGAGTPRRNPTGTPGETPAAPPAPKGAGTPLTSGGTPRGTGPVKGAGTPGTDGADAPAEYPTDEVLLPVLRNPAKVPRDPDGTVPVKRVMRLMNVGRNRAIRLLDTAGLTPGTGTGTPDAKGAGTPGDTPADGGSGDDQERHPEPLNGSREHPEFAGVA